MASTIRHVLVVDESATRKQTLTDLLSKHGYSVEQAENGRQALACLGENNTIDLVLSALSIEDVDGLTLLKKCRDTETEQPVICIVDATEQEKVEDALRCGAKACLTKPLDEDGLLAAIRQVERTRQQHAISRLNELIREVKLTFVISSADLSVAKVQKILQENLLNYTPLSEQEVLNLMMAFEESILNAHEHGNLELDSAWKEEFTGKQFETRFDIVKQERLENPQYGKRKLRIELVISSDRIQFTVHDDGQGFNTSAIALRDDVKPYGMGLTIIKNLMDEIHFNETGNCITFVKKFHPTNEPN